MTRPDSSASEPVASEPATVEPATTMPAATALPAEVRRFLTDTLRFATIATVGIDGSPHQAVVWFDLLADALLLNSALGRRWPADLLRDPRVSLSVEDGYDWVSVQGRAEPRWDPEQAQADIAALARRYHPDDPDLVEREIARFRTQRRITFLVRPTAVHAEIEEG